MPIQGQIETLYHNEDKTNAIFPRTVFNAVTGSNGETWQEALDAKQNKLVDQSTQPNKYLHTYQDSEGVKLEWADVAQGGVTGVKGDAGTGLTINSDNQLVAVLPLCPTTTDGTYVLKATVASGAVTYSWVAGS